MVLETPSLYTNVYVMWDKGFDFGSFTMANSYSFLSPYDIYPIDQENKYLRKLSYIIMKLYAVCTH